jgi:hypothetical protein
LHLRDAEIEHLDQRRAVRPLRQEQVRRLQIAMHDAERAVRLGQRFANL